MNIDLEQVVFTTKYVIENNSPIIYVSHDLEGDWQFFGKEKNLTEDDGRIASLGEIVEIEPSIKEILWIPKGMQAWLDVTTKEWSTSVQ